MTRARGKRQPLYVTHVARQRYRCIICGNDIEPGQRYNRRRRRYTGGQYVTIAKCSGCLPIKGGNHDDGKRTAATAASSTARKPIAS